MKCLAIRSIFLIGFTSFIQGSTHAQTFQNWITQGNQVSANSGNFLVEPGYVLEALRQGYKFSIIPSTMDTVSDTTILVSPDNGTVIKIGPDIGATLWGGLARGVDARYTKLIAMNEQSKKDLQQQLDATKAALTQNVAALDSVLKRLKILECRQDPAKPACLDETAK